MFDIDLHAAADSIIWEHARKENAVIVSNEALVAWLEPLWQETLKRLEPGERFIELRG